MKLDTEDVVRCRAVCRHFHDLSVERVLKSHTKLCINANVYWGDKDCFHLDHRVPSKNNIWSDSPLEMQDIKVISRLFPSVSVFKFNTFMSRIKYDPLVASLQLFPNIVCLSVNKDLDQKEILQMEPTDKLIHLKANSITSDDDETELNDVFPSLQSLEFNNVDNGFVFPICNPSRRLVLRGSQENSFHWSLFASSLEVIEAVIDFSDYSRKYQPSHPRLHSLSVDITTNEEEQRERVDLTGLMNFILDNKQSLRNLAFSAVNATNDSLESLLASLSFIEKLEITLNSSGIARSISHKIKAMPNMKYLSLVYKDDEDSAYFTNDVWPHLPSDLDNLSIQGIDPSISYTKFFWIPFIKSMLKIGMKQVTIVGMSCDYLDEWQKTFDRVEDNHDDSDDDEGLIDHKFVIRVRQTDCVVTLANEPESIV